MMKTIRVFRLTYFDWYMVIVVTVAVIVGLIELDEIRRTLTKKV